MAGNRNRDQYDRQPYVREIQYPGMERSRAVRYQATCFPSISQMRLNPFDQAIHVSVKVGIGPNGNSLPIR